MKVRARSLWLWSWVVTFPLTAFGLVWLLPVWRDARQFLVFHPANRHVSSDVTLTLRQLLQSRLNQLQEDLTSSWKSRWSGGTTPLPKIDLEVAPANLALLNASLPQSGKRSFVPAMLRYPNGNFEEVTVRYRGDSLHHWGFASKSWLIRTERDQLLAGQRRLHVVLPRWRSVANYHLNLKVASDLGLLSVSSTPVDLRINGRQHGGIHLLQPQVDEAFLRGRGLAPGDVYVGDMTWLDDDYVNEQPKGGLWELPWLWQKAASNPKAPEASTAPLEVLVQAINRAPIDNLIRLLDLDAWARFSAYMQLVAANHMDQGHNWKLYYDPTRLVFVPIVGDGNGLPDDIMKLTEDIPGRDVSITTPLLGRLHQDHRFLRLKNAALANFYGTQGDQRFFERLESFATQIAPTLRIFPQLDWIGLVDGKPIHYFNDADLRARIERVTPDLRAWFAQHRSNLATGTGDVKLSIIDPHTLRVALSGRGSVRLALQMAASAPSTDVSLAIQRPNGRREAAQLHPRVQVSENGRRLDLDWDLLAQRVIDLPSPTKPAGTHGVSTVTYDLVLSAPIAAETEVYATNGLGDRFKLIPTQPFEAIELADSNTAVLPTDFPVIRWTGVKTLSGLTEIAGDLEIAEGTLIRLGPGASLVVRGAIRAHGSSQHPIRIEAESPNQPWGVIAIIGSSGRGSQFDHCTISGGSSLSSAVGQLDGMLSFRDAGQVTLNDCQLSTATAHAISSGRSPLVIRRTRISDIRRNGIDLFGGPVEIDGLVVERSGRNAIELTETDATILNCRILRSGDHAILSRGHSRTIVLNTLVKDHVVGLHATDGAEVIAYNTTLTGSQLPLVASRAHFVSPNLSKITLAKCSVETSPLPFDLRDGSLLTVEDSEIHGNWRNPQAKIDPDSSSASAPGSPRHSSSWGQILPGRHWEQTSPNRRGAPAEIVDLPSPSA